MLTSPGPAPASVADAMATFSPGELTELMAGVGLMHGFSKLLIALNAEPEGMERTELPTPLPTGLATTDGDPASAYGRLLADRPDLASAWLHMESEMRNVEGLPSEMLDAIEQRSAQLHGVADLVTDTQVSDGDGQGEGVALARELTELFALDVRSITDEHRGRIAAATEGNGFVGLMMTLAVYDGIHRFAACTPTPA